MAVLQTDHAQIANPFLGDKLSKDNSSVRNRTKYSYVLNTPTSFTDPSGFSTHCEYSSCGRGGGGAGSFLDGFRAGFTFFLHYLLQKDSLGDLGELEGGSTSYDKEISQTVSADSVFNVVGGTDESRAMVLGVIGKMLATNVGSQLYKTWVAKHEYADKILVDLDCLGCTENNAIAYVQLHPSKRHWLVFSRTTGGFDVHLPTEVHSYYKGLLGDWVPFGIDTVIAHEIFGHGFAGLRNEDHAQVVRYTNQIMREIDANYIPASTYREHISDRF